MANWQGAEISKEFEKVGISPEQFKVVLKAMKACKGYRSVKQIEGLAELCAPDYIELVRGEEIERKYGPYRPLVVQAKT